MVKRNIEEFSEAKEHWKMAVQILYFTCSEDMSLTQDLVTMEHSRHWYSESGQ